MRCKIKVGHGGAAEQIVWVMSICAYVSTDMETIENKWKIYWDNTEAYTSIKIMSFMVSL